MPRLVAVSNRTAADAASRAGGLAVALWDALVDCGGAWFGWSGDVVEQERRGLRSFVDEGVEFALADLTQEEYDGFYLGYANRSLWPTFHYRVDLATFNEEDFAVYDAVNRRFARLIKTRLRDDDILWVHDYHFLLLGEAVRQEGWAGPMGFFLHIPFPAPEIFKTLPEHRRIAHAMMSFNLLGFQTRGDRDNFERYILEDCDGVVEPDGGLRAFETSVVARAYPIGIDTAAFTDLAGGADANAAAGRIDRFLGERKLVLGVDRMDYSKGLPERFEAVGRLFDTYPENVSRVSFTQIAPPSRSKVEEYVELREHLDRLAGRINGDYGDLDWIPIRYLARSYPRESLAGLYRLAAVALVTPLHDGMNLVAKEYVAAQDPEDPGVLVLSEFAGAADQLSDALLVNPYDVSGVADAINQALNMPLEERKERWGAMMRGVVDQDIGWWRETYLSDLSAVRASAG
ncbi:MAG: trehalose-6-phosphate synthase [Pseudomonadota bacterium]